MPDFLKGFGQRTDSFSPRESEDKTSTRKRPRGAFSRSLAIAFASVALLTAGLAGVLLSAVWNYQFEGYVRDNLQTVADSISQTVTSLYPDYGFGLTTLTQVPDYSSQSIGVQMLNSKNEIVYSQASSRQRGSVVATQGAAVLDAASLLQPTGTTVTSQITVNGEKVGTVRVWGYGTTALMTSRDSNFRQGSLIGLAVAALVALILSGLVGLWYAGRLVRPIARITATAQALRGGNEKARTGLQPYDEIGFLGTTFDEMADAIEADREVERRLTADVAHELRTPLQAIQATVEAMQDGVLPADDERLGIVRSETMRLARLADGILQLTRLECGSLPMELSRMDLSATVRLAVDMHEALFETRKIVLSVDIEDAVFVNGDADRLQQAVSNLLSNAARYTSAGGRVGVRVRREDGEALIEVLDTGIGIAEEDMPRVFSRFWRADAARGRSSGGLGIGLAVTKEIVERHGGVIGVARRLYGGTIFTIHLPLI
ncbi:MAG: HAMP domain-containing histidine kinase [Coriobacteriia bacterium]|nr:HAMP domain-containing histidine kinase [Coriobacteriia bacterium]